jgi:hypothetical protein
VFAAGEGDAVGVRGGDGVAEANIDAAAAQVGQRELGAARAEAAQ